MKSAFEFWVAIFETYRFFFVSNFAFSVVSGETLLPKGAYRPWDHFRFFGKTLLCMLNYLSSLGFGGFRSFLFSLYNLMIYGTLCGRPQAPRRRRRRQWPIAVRAAPGPTAAAVAHCGAGGPRPHGVYACSMQ